MSKNQGMEVFGRIQNGVVVFDAPNALPEGALVRVLLDNSPSIRVAGNPQRVEFPLVPSDAPGSVHLTNDRIAEILEDEDVQRPQGQ